MAKIFLDIGHGSNTFPPGKGVYRNGKGYAEHDFNSKLGMTIKDLLEQHGHTIIMAQQPNAPEVGLTARTNYYNRENADFGISVHANASGSSAANGRCIFYWHTSTQGKALATAIRDEIKAKGYSTHGNGLHASRIGSWTNLHMVRETKMPTVLIEHGFMTGNKDFKLIFGAKQDQYIKDMAEADVRGIQKWLGEPYKGEAKVESSTASKSPSKPKPAKKKDDTSVAGARLVKHEDAYFLATENIKVRNAPSTSATHTGTLPKGASINYKKVYEGNGYRWLQYVGNTGNTLYLPYRPINDINNQWGTFHSERPSASQAKPKKKSVSQVAQEVLDGKWGNNPQRKRDLEKAGYDYSKVQAEVNKLAGGKSAPKKSVNVDSIARQILKGVDNNGKRIPNGHSARQKHFGLSNSDYKKVRNRVNQLA